MNSLLKKWIFLSALFSFGFLNLSAQIWEIGYTTISFTDPSRGNRVIDANVFYPADVTGNNVPLGSPFDKRFPLIVFGHDEGTAWNNYQYIWNRWTIKGFIVVLPVTEMGPTMDVEEFAKDMAFIASQFLVIRQDPNSFWYKKVNNKSTVIGHGKGGSAAVFAVQYHPQITTVITLAANEVSPGTIAAASQVTQPAVVVGGGQDCVSPFATVQEGIFNNMNSTCKTLINFTAVPRCDWASNAGACTSNQITCGGPMPYSWQSTATATTYYLVSFMRYFMKFNEPTLEQFEWKLQQKTVDFNYVFACNLNAPRLSGSPEDNEIGEWRAEQYQADLEDFAVLNVKMYPNPVARGSEAQLEIESDMNTTAQVLITNLMGQMVAVNEVELNEYYTTVPVETGNLAKGNYMVTVSSPGQRHSRPLIVN